jgi:hypothetical protein
MKLDVLCRGETASSKRSFHIPLSAGLPSAPPAPSIMLRSSAPEVKPVSGEVSCGVFAAYAAALASTGFLFVMALTGGIHLN